MVVNVDFFFLKKGFVLNSCVNYGYGLERECCRFREGYFGGGCFLVLLRKTGWSVEGVRDVDVFVF